MSRLDFRGCAISGATPVALEAFERAFAAFYGWRTGADAHLEVALQEAPDFVMAHVLQACLCLCSRDPARVRGAQPVLARASRLRANERERLHLAAIAASLDDDYERAKDLFGKVLQEYPRDLLALQMAHCFDYTTGDVARMGDRVPAVLPAWSRGVPGYHAVLAMHGFGLEECGDYERAEESGRHALELNPLDARAHHVLAHVFEMTERPDAGVRWMHERIAYWAGDTMVATHCWWHLALFHFAQGRLDRALALYDRRVRARRSPEVADLIDASALLWRVYLSDGDTGTRWQELAAAWAPHIDDAFCTFNDVHAMLAFVGAGDWDLARRLVRRLERREADATRHGETTRSIGVPACRALTAFGRGDFADAIGWFARLPAVAHRIGGSHAQRDVLHLTMLRAVQNIRRPAPRSSIAA